MVILYIVPIVFIIVLVLLLNLAKPVGKFIDKILIKPIKNIFKNEGEDTYE